MNNRKQHVLNKAHELFIEKGFQSTSIQEILDSSGISKGTFYNYFSGKNELLISIFKSVYSEIGEKRKQLMVGQDKTDSDVFIRQIELLIKTNKQYKIISLFEEILYTNDEELKLFLKRRRIQELNWLYNRLMDICGPNKKPYLLDSSIMLNGILHNIFYFHSMENQKSPDVHKIVQYSVNRIINMIDYLSETEERLLEPELLIKWLSESAEDDMHTDGKNIVCIIESLKLTVRNTIKDSNEQKKYEELMDFIQEEMVKTEAPRYYVVISAVNTLKELLKDTTCKKIVEKLEKKVILDSSI
jgi:AcrR family transcriptional regulator